MFFVIFSRGLRDAFHWVYEGGELGRENSNLAIWNMHKQKSPKQMKVGGQFIPAKTVQIGPCYSTVKFSNSNIVFFD